MRKILVAALVLVCAGCGYEGQPLPPLANVPGRVTGISTTQHGSSLVVQFAPPQLTTEGFPIKPPLELDVRVGPGGEPFDEAAWAASARKLSPGPHSAYEMPVAEWAGKDLIVGVRAVGNNGKQSGWTVAAVPIVAAQQPPPGLRAENTAGGVRLSWQGSNAVRIYRKSADGTFAPLADVSQSPWTDSSTQFGQEYAYKVQTIVKLSEGHEAESELSAEMSITPRDTFPPATPSGLQVAAAPGSAELSWNGNVEADLANYRVYRSVGGEPFERVGQADLPAWSDRNVETGKEYRYEVTAVDRSGNESPRSEAVEVHFE